MGPKGGRVMSRSRCTADHRRNSNRNGTHGEFYAFEQYGIEPDIFTLAKGLGNGLPVGAMLGKTDLQQGLALEVTVVQLWW